MTDLNSKRLELLGAILDPKRSFGVNMASCISLLSGFSARKSSHTWISRAGKLLRQQELFNKTLNPWSLTDYEEMRLPCEA